MRTDIPLVPFVRAAGGFVYLFPDQVRAAAGIAARGTAGLAYFLYDWLGLSAGVGMSLGRVFFDESYRGSRTWAVIDFAMGFELQF